MTRGIYITANDRVTDHAIALLNSLRLRDRETPIVMIPYDDNYQKIYEVIGEKYNVQLYKDLEFIDRISRELHGIFGEKFFARPNQFRKQACWFGDFDEFLYIDTDVVVFEKIADNLDYLKDADFMCCDYQFSGGITNVFTPKVFDDNIFTEEDVKDIFNGGLWGSKKNLITEGDLYDSFRECAAHPEYFDFSQKTSDQPIINYMILKRVPKRFNIVRRPGKAPGSWAGSPHFQPDGDRLFDPKTNQPLQYLHWAGIRIEPGCPYWDVWEHYRYLGEPKPERPVFSQPKKSWTRQLIDSVKSTLRRFKP
ncbi:MAG: methionine synthase [Cyanobacteria bacterium SBC]|nr:methionine synthase [Cyanobacteria bacterium SBC]